MAVGLAVAALVGSAAAPDGAAAQRRSAVPAPPETSSTRVQYRREVFRYTGGARDPFRTLIAASDVRRTLADLKVVTIIYDPRYGNSVAIVREAGVATPHRLRRGGMIGRLRVVQIRQYEVVFEIEEFGFNRQEVLTLARPEGAP